MAGGGCARVGGGGDWDCLKYLKRGWDRKKGRRNKGFKKGGRLSQGLGALKREGSWNPLMNYENFAKLAMEVG